MMLKKKLVVAGALAVLLGLTACANPGETPASGDTPGGDAKTTAVEAVPEIAEMLPKEIRDRGTLQIGATSTNMPAQFTDESGKLVGVAVELYEAAAKVLDVEAEFDIVTFDALQPGVESGRYDLATMGANVERQKIFDIVSIYSNGFSTITHASSKTDKLNWKEDLCGHSVGVTKGTLTDRVLSGEVNDACLAAGKPAIEVSTYVDNAGVALAVTSEQDEFGVLEVIVALAYADRDPDVLKIVDTEVTTSSGPATPKANTELRDAFHTALLHLVEIGFYEEVLTKYGIAAQALPELPINIAK